MCFLFALILAIVGAFQSFFGFPIMAESIVDCRFVGQIANFGQNGPK
jgi:hypothetical protein